MSFDEKKMIPLVVSSTPFRTAYGPVAAVQLDTGEESNVKQSFKDEVDVNKIVVRFQNTGVLPDATRGVAPLFLDVSEMPSYQEALNHVRSVTEFFEALPAETREAFGNDPAFFMDFVSDPANVEEAAKYGVEAAGTVGAPDGAAVSSNSGEATTA